MLAALITGAHRLELVEFPDPTPPPGGVDAEQRYTPLSGVE